MALKRHLDGQNSEDEAVRMSTALFEQEEEKKEEEEEKIGQGEKRR